MPLDWLRKTLELELSAEEKAEGWCLPCVALAQSDLVLEQPLALAVPG